MIPSARAAESVTGLSVGDALGQCFFGLSGAEQERVLAGDLLPEGPWYYTDDTEMSLAVQAVLQRFGSIDQDALASEFAHRYRFDRGYGPAMHRALMRVRDGEPWRVVSYSLFDGQGSYGNGAAMRAAPIGAFFSESDQRVVENAARSAEVTHAHPEGVSGAVAVAVAASMACRFRAEGLLPSHSEFVGRILPLVPAGDLRERLARAREMSVVQSIDFPVSVLGAGAELSARDTVPFAIWCCAQQLGDYEGAIRLGLRGGVDRDTICAIIGGIVACYVGAAAIPAEWLRRREALPS